MDLDSEEKANRYLGAMGAVRDMLGASHCGAQLDASNLCYLVSVLRDEAERLMLPPARKTGPNIDHRGVNDAR